MEKELKWEIGTADENKQPDLRKTEYFLLLRGTLLLMAF